MAVHPGEHVAAGGAARVDERALGAGTTLRFALLVALLLASSSLILLYVALALSPYDGFVCSLAAGVDPVTDPAANVMAKRALQWEAYQSCSERAAAPPSGWWLLGWWALLALGTVALFRALPAWKARRSRVVPLAAVDRDGEIGRTLTELSATAGLARPPRAVVDLAADSAGAVVFGRTGRPTVCLHGGLVAARTTDPGRFRAVLLHELAHIANRDVTVTYLTVALWRVYAAVAVPLFLLWCAWKVHTAYGSQAWSAEAPIVTRGLLVTGLLAVLVHLARSDVLRSREVYADLAAVRWGADPAAGWSTAAAPAPAGGRGRRARHAFVALWHLHPGWDVRRAALADPAVLFGVRALPLALTGAAAAIVHTHITYAITQYYLLTVWMQHAAALVPAALVAGVVGTALWRAAVYAALTGQPAPSSVRAGLWLGLGLAGGSAVAGQGTVNEWLPARPWVFALVVAAAMAFTWWLTQCAHLWVVAWRGRSLRGVALLNLAAAALALSLWFVWWQNFGAAYAAGWSFDAAALRDLQLTFYAGKELDHPPASPVDRAYVLLMTVGTAVTSPPLALLALAGLWVTPLLAWLPRPGADPPRWVRAAAPGDGPAPGPPPPRLRRVLVAGLIGGAAGSLAAVTHTAWLHGRERPSATTFLMTFVAGTIVALLIAAAGAGAAARVAVPAHRLPAALVAGAAATFLGSATVMALRVFDGCVPALALDSGPCPGGLAGPLRMFPLVLVPTLPITALVAGVAALPRPRAASRPGRPRSMALARSCALVLVAGGLAVAAVHAVQRMPYAGRLPAASETQRLARQGAYLVVDAPVSAQSRALQAQAWLDLGGDDLLDRFWRGRRDLFAAVTSGVQAGRSIDRLDDVRPLCAEISDFARAAARYFRFPEPETQALWDRFVALAWQGSQECQQALDADQAEQFNTAMRKLASAQDTGHAIDDRIEALIRQGGL
ncbi:M56 family metallopeptidase [Micromonospora haikouensis]|uniref:M56 family metallopeptidase n=1 Tax=Micromonospora haikouensis TaxID=686309 RepID=UPI00379B6CDA